MTLRQNQIEIFKIVSLFDAKKDTNDNISFTGSKKSKELEREGKEEKLS